MIRSSTYLLVAALLILSGLPILLLNHTPAKHPEHVQEHLLGRQTRLPVTHKPGPASQVRDERPTVGHHQNMFTRSTSSSSKNDEHGKSAQLVNRWQDEVHVEQQHHLGKSAQLVNKWQDEVHVEQQHHLGKSAQLISRWRDEVQEELPPPPKNAITTITTLAPGVPLSFGLTIPYHDRVWAGNQVDYFDLSWESVNRSLFYLMDRHPEWSFTVVLVYTGEQVSGLQNRSTHHRVKVKMLKLEEMETNSEQMTAEHRAEQLAGSAVFLGFEEIQVGVDWMMHLDSDVLVKKNWVEEMVALESVSSHVIPTILTGFNEYEHDPGCVVIGVGGGQSVQYNIKTCSAGLNFMFKPETYRAVIRPILEKVTEPGSPPWVQSIVAILLSTSPTASTAPTKTKKRGAMLLSPRPGVVQNIGFHVSTLTASNLLSNDYVPSQKDLDVYKYLIHEMKGGYNFHHLESTKGALASLSYFNQKHGATTSRRGPSRIQLRNARIKESHDRRIYLTLLNMTFEDVARKAGGAAGFMRSKSAGAHGGAVFERSPRKGCGSSLQGCINAKLCFHSTHPGCFRKPLEAFLERGQLFDLDVCLYSDACAPCFPKSPCNRNNSWVRTWGETHTLGKGLVKDDYNMLRWTFSDVILLKEEFRACTSEQDVNRGTKESKINNARVVNPVKCALLNKWSDIDPAKTCGHLPVAAGGRVDCDGEATRKHVAEVAYETWKQHLADIGGESSYSKKLFIGSGTGRSGTTSLQGLLGQQSSALVSHENSLIYQSNEGDSGLTALPPEEWKPKRSKGGKSNSAIFDPAREAERTEKKLVTRRALQLYSGRFISWDPPRTNDHGAPRTAKEKVAWRRREAMQRGVEMLTKADAMEDVNVVGDIWSAHMPYLRDYIALFGDAVRIVIVERSCDEVAASFEKKLKVDKRTQTFPPRDHWAGNTFDPFDAAFPDAGDEVTRWDGNRLQRIAQYCELVHKMTKEITIEFPNQARMYSIEDLFGEDKYDTRVELLKWVGITSALQEEDTGKLKRNANKERKRQNMTHHKRRKFEHHGKRTSK